MIGDLRVRFPGAPGYLDTATCGLPSCETLADVQQHLDGWRDGTAAVPADFHAPVEESRALFGRLVGVPLSQVAVGAQVSAMVGAVAASLPPGSRVVLAEGDFTSLLWPFLARPDLLSVCVPLADVPDAVARGCDWAAVSTVQSSTGALVDLPALRRAADEAGARVLLDATQSTGWLPLDASQWDVVVVGAYKWLLSPRGSAFLTVSRGVLDELRPLAAGWYAGEDVPTSYYGAPVRLLVDAGVEAVHAHDLGLADAFRARLGLPPGNSAIVSLGPEDGYDGAADALRAAGLRCAGRAGRTRVAFHLYNDATDVDRAAGALGR